MIPKRYPKFRNLQAFESVGRLGSFKDAANELNLTPSAISHRITDLEEQLGEPLFEKSGRGAMLTAKGRMFLSSVQAVLDQLSAATDKIKHEGVSGKLTVSLYPTIAHRWLIPRLQRFRTKYPEVEIHLEITQKPEDFSSLNVDAAICYANSRIPGYLCDFMVSERLIAVCSSQFLQLNPEIKQPQDIRKSTLIHNTIRPEQWQWWMEQAGMRATHTGDSIFVTSRDAAIDAAAAGLGFALAHIPLVNDELLRKRIISPFDFAIPFDDFGFYLVIPETKTEIPRIMAFRDWILSELKNQ